MSCGVTVAHRILVPLVWVRILAGQQTYPNYQLVIIFCFRSRFRFVFFFSVFDMPIVGITPKQLSKKVKVIITLIW